MFGICMNVWTGKICCYFCMLAHGLFGIFEASSDFRHFHGLNVSLAYAKFSQIKFQLNILALHKIASNSIVKKFVANSFFCSVSHCINNKRKMF